MHIPHHSLFWHVTALHPDPTIPPHAPLHAPLPSLTPCVMAASSQDSAGKMFNPTVNIDLFNLQPCVSGPNVRGVVRASRLKTW
ncbi:hypothetical protein Pmani_027501 [Petrolisthes manimaculis]|uniref:Uncharacterized protein n=1 Tax=Petrolisthes manimaculis TaxID=1843537 RepID=A0AAE1P1B0_9EUCA|nr:hypothetical protein Pmani_027501 [Petrolisthes manimaculis]